MRTVLVKVGGSLLTLPDLPGRLRTMFGNLRADRILLLAGGGAAANVVRNWDQIHKLDTEVSHWLAVDSMRLSAMLLAGLLPEASLAGDRKTIEHAQGKVVIIEPGVILDELSLTVSKPLPIGWDCTSDSIAGWIASHWRVDLLVLVKSVDMPVESEDFRKSESGAVDACFDSVIAPNLKVDWCNLRTQPELITQWRAASET